MYNPDNGQAGRELTYEELVGEDVAQNEALEEGLKLKAHDLFLRLQSSFPDSQFITLEEVRDATGFDGVRTADAMAISMYRSRGKAVYGFEMKVSRADWLKELKQPENLPASEQAMLDACYPKVKKLEQEVFRLAHLSLDDILKKKEVNL